DIQLLKRRRTDSRLTERPVMVGAFVADFQRGPLVSVPEDASKHLLLVELRQEGDFVAVNFLVIRMAVEGLAVECERWQEAAASVPANFGKTLLLAPRGERNAADDQECENGGAQPGGRRGSDHDQQ